MFALKEQEQRVSPCTRPRNNCIIKTLCAN